MIQKFFRYIIGVLIISSIVFIPVKANGIDVIIDPNNIVGVQYVFFDVYRDWFDISALGVAECTTLVSANSVDSIHVYSSVQQLINGQWTSKFSWSQKVNGVENLLMKSFNISRGIYRYKTTVYLYKNGNLIESDSKTSPQVTY